MIKKLKYPLLSNAFSNSDIKCGLKELTKRDTKGLYKKAKNKLVNNLVGFNSKIKYEKSNYKKIIVDTEKYNISKCTNLILKKIL